MSTREEYQYVDATITIGGVPFPAARVDVERVPPQDDDQRPAFTSMTTLECSVDVPAWTLEHLVDALTPRRRGASDATLARRITYGGRKGRSAQRRLAARGDPAFDAALALNRAVDDKLALNRELRIAELLQAKAMVR